MSYKSEQRDETSKKCIEIAGKSWAEAFGKEIYNFTPAEKRAVGSISCVIIENNLRSGPMTEGYLMSATKECIETAASNWAKMIGHHIGDDPEIYSLNDTDKLAIGDIAAVLLKDELESEEHP